jgi:hypothetical protein
VSKAAKNAEPGTEEEQRLQSVVHHVNVLQHASQRVLVCRILEVQPRAGKDKQTKLMISKKWRKKENKENENMINKIK